LGARRCPDMVRATLLVTARSRFPMARYRCVRPTIVYVLLALSLSQESDSASMGQQNFEMRRVTTWPGTVESKSSMSTEALDDPGLGLESGAHNQEGQTFNSPISKDSSFALPLGENAFDTSSAEHRSPLSHILLMFKNQEQAMLLQAQRCRSAVRRLETLEAIMMNSREKQPVASTVLSEVEDWNQCALEMQNKLKDIFGGAGKRMALLLGEKEPAEESALFGGVKIDVPNKSDSLPDLARMVDGGVAAHPHKEGRKTKLKLMHTASLPVLSSMLSPQLEERFRVGTWNDIAVYGVEKMKDGHYEYAKGTELHVIWDIDQTKLVGEGTNDVELVLKCVLWWKEELEHDLDFIPHDVDPETREEFIDYCKKFDIAEAFDRLMPFLARPFLRDFVKAHPQAKWWTFTNKDRTVEGEIIRDVSDEDGLVGMYQEDKHEVSGRPVKDANKYALLLLSNCTDAYAGFQCQSRPVVGVRGQQKDLKRITKMIDEQNRQNGVTNRPVTLVLIDDKDMDAYGGSQANEPRCLCLVPAYNAVNEERGAELKATMESILPVDTLRKFYKAFKTADPSHALVQCVEIMSDDQSTLLKREGMMKDPAFVYLPKLEPKSAQPPPLPTFKPVLPPSLHRASTVVL